MLAFFAFTDVLYGHAIPTPLAFKGIVLSSVLFHTIPLLAATVGDVLRTLAEPGLLLVSIAIAPLVLHSLARDRTLLREGQWSFAVFIFAAAAIGWAVTELSSRAVGWSGNAYDRYGAVLFPTLLVLYAVGLETLQERGLRAYTRALGTLVPAVLALLIVTDKTPLPREGKFSNRTWAYDAGALTQAIVAPTDLVVSTSEMNTFGLAIADRQVLDFWGYTNPAIAHSHLCNGDRYRIAPDEFLRVGPDIYWPYIFTHEPTYDYDSMEIGLAEFHHVNHEGNNLGDMMKVMALYDVVVVMAGERQVVYLVRKERVQLVSGRLAQLGFRLTRTRAFDTDAFRTMYESLPITTFPC